MHLKSVLLLSLLISFNAFADYTDSELHHKYRQCRERNTELKNLIKIEPYRYISETNKYEFPSKMGPYDVEIYIEDCHEDLAYYHDAFKVLDDEGNILFERSVNSRNLTEVVPDDEFPFYILRDHSGGAHCCYTSYYFSKTKPYRYIGTLKSRDVRPSYKDYDGDGHAELRELDAILTYWYTSFAGSNFLYVVYRTIGEEIHPAPDLILQEMEYKDVESGLEYIRGEIEKHYEQIKRYPPLEESKKDQFLHEIATVTTQFLYADMKKEAWEFYDRIWDEMGYGYLRKLSFKREIERQIFRSSSYHSFYARSVVHENLAEITSLSKDCVYMRDEDWGEDEKSEVGYTDINLRELHNEECGGDPNTDLSIGYFRVYYDGRIEEFDYLDGQLRDL